MVETRKSLRRPKQAFPAIDPQALRNTMTAFEHEISGLAGQVEGGPLVDTHPDERSHALKVLPDDNSSVQWSPDGSGVTANVERTFKRYVTQHDSVSEHRRTDSEIWRPVCKKLAEGGVDVPFQEKVVIESQDHIKFKSEWRNGMSQAYEAVSLDIADANGIKDMDRRWRANLSAVAVGSSEDASLHFLAGRLAHNSLLMLAYEAPKAILAESSYMPDEVDEKDTGDFVLSIEQLYRRPAA